MGRAAPGSGDVPFPGSPLQQQQSIKPPLLHRKSQTHQTRLRWAWEHMEAYPQKHRVQKPHASPQKPNRLEQLFPNITEGTCHWEVNNRRLKCVYCLHSKRTSWFTYTQAAKTNTLSPAGASGPGRAAECPPRAQNGQRTPCWRVVRLGISLRPTRGTQQLTRTLLITEKFQIKKIKSSRKIFVLQETNCGPYLDLN